MLRSGDEADVTTERRSMRETAVTLSNLHRIGTQQVVNARFS
jgi:hypothetical protein